MTYRVALTGGIASGKSAVAAEFMALGVPLIDTDQISREVMAPGTGTFAKIVAAFGPEVVDASGTLNRGIIRERIFASDVERKTLESITHPAIRQTLKLRAEAAVGPYQIHAIPLFVETGAKGNYDRVLVVDCPTQIQIQRVMKRDGADENLARMILAAQATREERRLAADDVIENDGTLDTLHEKVRILHTRYLSLAAAKTAADNAR